MSLTLLALILPLSLDTFAVSVALGVAQLSPRERWRLVAAFALAEALMPLLGYAFGSVAGGLLGGVGEYVAAAILALAGVMMLREDDNEHPAGAAGLRGWSLMAAALAISLDELAIGVTIGLLRLPIAWVVLFIGLQAVVASQLGLALGGKLGDDLGEWAERAAGVLLLLLALALVAARLAGWEL